ncbi:collagen-like protein [Candidatus Falkowbacteria bacterium]|nr:collagen-like protein [Candidatus Falkowbacteria bacterium]
MKVRHVIFAFVAVAVAFVAGVVGLWRTDSGSKQRDKDVVQVELPAAIEQMKADPEFIATVKGNDGVPGQEGEPGIAGPQGEQGSPGEAGPAGVSCWDLNADGVQDTAEDANGDGAVDVLDCRGPKGDAGGQALANVQPAKPAKPKSAVLAAPATVPVPTRVVYNINEVPLWAPVIYAREGERAGMQFNIEKVEKCIGCPQPEADDE